MDELNEAWTELEKAGYAFTITKESITEPNSDYEHYFVVEVQHSGSVIGTRSEVDRAEAMMRAIELARIHRDEPERVPDLTLIE